MHDQRPAYLKMRVHQVQMRCCAPRIKTTGFTTGPISAFLSCAIPDSAPRPADRRHLHLHLYLHTLEYRISCTALFTFALMTTLGHVFSACHGRVPPWCVHNSTSCSETASPEIPSSHREIFQSHDLGFMVLLYPVPIELRPATPKRDTGFPLADVDLSVGRNMPDVSGIGSCPEPAFISICRTRHPWPPMLSNDWWLGSDH